MPDISMCRNEGCTLNKDCYRYIAMPNARWQAYTSFQQDPSGHCENYWPTD